MSFEYGFEFCERVNVPDVRRKRVPEFGSRAAEGSAPHGTEADRGNRERGGGGGSERAGRGDNMEKI